MHHAEHRATGKSARPSLAELGGVDVTSAAFKADPFPFYARLRDEAPVFPVVVRRKRRAWLVTRYEDVVTVLKDHETFVKDRTAAMSEDQLARAPRVPRVFAALERNLLALDGSDHARLKALVHCAFTASTVESVRSMTEVVTAAALDRVEAMSNFDLVADFGLAVPLTIIGRMLGVPDRDHAKFGRWWSAFVAVGANASPLFLFPSMLRLVWYLRRLIQSRRKRPADDLVSALVLAQEGDERLTDDEVLAMVLLLLSAGHETTANLVGTGVLALLSNPDPLARLRREPELVGSAVEELLRFAGPAETATERYATRRHRRARRPRTAAPAPAPAPAPRSSRAAALAAGLHLARAEVPPCLLLSSSRAGARARAASEWQAMRVASLLPSATELVCILGPDAQRELVGVSHECDFPDGLAGLPVLTKARLAPVRTSREIDRDVRALIDDALAVYEIEIERLEAARPDVIVTQDLCDVCAVSLDDVNAAVARLARKDVRIVNLHPMRLADVWGDVLRVAEALGRSEAGARVVATLRARVDAIAARAHELTVTSRPRVLSIEWIDPVMIGGLWMPELITLAGGEALVTKAGEHAPTLDRAALAQLDPDIVVVKPCGFSLGRTLEELPAIRAMLPWDQWRAVREGQVFIADGNAYFNRPGPRIVESLEVLAACTHPRAFHDLRVKHASSVVRVDADQRHHAFDAGL